MSPERLPVSTARDHEVRLAIAEQHINRLQDDVHEIKGTLSKFAESMESKMDSVTQVIMELKRGALESVPPWAAREMATAKASKAALLTVCVILVTALGGLLSKVLLGL